jgi:hypothetical protein
LETKEFEISALSSAVVGNSIEENESQSAYITD